MIIPRFGAWDTGRMELSLTGWRRLWGMWHRSGGRSGAYWDHSVYETCKCSCGIHRWVHDVKFRRNEVSETIWAQHACKDKEQKMTEDWALSDSHIRGRSRNSKGWIRASRDVGQKAEEWAVLETKWRKYINAGGSDQLCQMLSMVKVC